MTIQLKVTIIATALLTVAAHAHAQSKVRMEGSTSGRAAAHPSDTVAGGETALRATVAADLPEAPVRRTIAEGEARGASAASIDRAAMQVHGRLKVARESLTREERGARRPTDSEIAAGAEAIAAGAATADIEALRDAAPRERSLTASLEALTELRSRGIRGSDAAAAIATRLETGASDRAIGELAARVRSAAELGLASTGGSAATALDASTTLSGAAGGVGATLGAGVSAAGSLGGVLPR